MKKWLFFIVVTFISMTAKGQNLTLIGERSYSCTNTVTLKSNIGDSQGLNIFFAKEGDSKFIAISRWLFNGEFTGKLVILLENGNVITWQDKEMSEEVNELTTALYRLTTDQLNKLKTSNIHTVKYTLNRRGEESNFAVSNNDFKTHEIISEFYRE